MKKSDFEEQKNEIEAIQGTYRLRFAGKPRATRNKQLLEQLIERLEASIEALDSAEAGDDPSVSALIDRAEQNLENYRQELENVEQAQSQSVPLDQSARLAARANLYFGQYFRHFANRGRSKRNLKLLDRIIGALEQIREQMIRLYDRFEFDREDKNLEPVEDHLELYRSEREAILEAQKEGDKEHRASLLAELANRQFQRYQNFFAGKPKPSRSIRQLDTIIGELERIHGEMKGLSEEGIALVQNQRNIRIVEEQLESYRTVREEVTEAKRDLTPDQQSRYLAAAADAVFETYRDHFAGKERETRDLQTLSRLCDELIEIQNQFDDLDLEGNEEADRTANLVMDHLMLYQNEYEQIHQIQNPEVG